MSNAPRPPTWNSRSRSCAGHERALGQRRSTSPAFCRASAVPHSGQWVGMTNSRSVPSRRSTTGPSTSGMTSPALRMTTRSPISTPLRRTSSALCSVASDTVDCATTTGSMNANGVTRPVRPDVDPDVEELRGDLLRRVLERDRPPRRARGGAEPPLQGHLVDLGDDAVDLVLDVVAVLAPVLGVGDDLVDPLEHHRALGDRKPPGAQRVVALGLPLQREALALAEAVADQPQVARRRDARILLPQRARRGVARVGVDGLARLDHERVERLEVRQPEVHLAAHLDQGGHGELGRAGELLRHLLQRAHVERDVLAGAPVAPGERAGEPAVLVQEVDRKPVDLQLAQVVQLLRPDVAGHPLGPRPQIVRAERVVEAEHALEVVVGGEIAREGAADLLGGRLRRDELGVLLLDRQQLAPQLVELAVGQHRRIEHVVAEPVAPDLLGQPGVPLADGFWTHGARLPSRTDSPARSATE